MDFAKLKSLFLKIMIGCLIASGTIAVVTVLTGSFNEIFGKSLVTILLVALHALFSFGYININEKNESANDLSFFHNTTFILIILSFITSVFGVWGVISGDLVGKLYATYFVLLFAVLHGETLSKMVGNDHTIDNVVYANYAFMMVVILLILPIIYSSDASAMGDVYYRLLAAFGIIDAILTLLAIILNKLYLQKHPKVDPSVFGNEPIMIGSAGAATTSQPKKGMSILVIILIAFLGLQLISGLVFAVLGRQAAKNIDNVNTRQPASSTTTPTTTPTTSTPTTFSSNPTGSYESTFVYNGVAYKCSQAIAGKWEADNSSYNNGAQGNSYVFVPTSQYDLTTYCKQY